MSSVASATAPIKIVLLYAEVVGYVVGMLKALALCGRPVSIDVVYWDKKHVNSTRFAIHELECVRFHARSSFSDAQLSRLLSEADPQVVLVSGWMDRGYIRAVRDHRSAGGRAVVVCGIDDQWHGTLRQHLGRLYFRWFYAKLFDFMWVSGKPQYHYANRMGYDHERIITNLYSADTRIFHQKSSVSKRFVFVGRFDPVKALDQLIDAYLLLPESTRRLWPLVLIGDGELRQMIASKGSETILMLPFLQPAELLTELRKGGVACITSRIEQWGVAIHEMALLGFPLVLSSACGAATEFLITGYNGFLFKRGNTRSLSEALHRITLLSDEELESFSRRSHELGSRIRSEHVAHSLLSVLPLSEL